MIKVGLVLHPWIVVRRSKLLVNFDELYIDTYVYIYMYIHFHIYRTQGFIWEHVCRRETLAEYRGIEFTQWTRYFRRRGCHIGGAWSKSVTFATRVYAFHIFNRDTYSIHCVFHFFLLYV